MSVLSSLALVPDVLIIVGLAVSAAYYLVMLYSARTFFGQKPRAESGEPLPGVSILKPLKGLDAQIFENLVGLCEQDYPCFQLILGVADADDPTVPLARRLQAMYPQIDIRLVVDARVYGPNYKVSSLHNMYQRAKHDIIVLADADIRAPRDYLRRLVTHLREPQVGLVTCLYRAVNTGGLPTLIESLFINTDWCHMVLVARIVERPTYAFGATIAMRRAMLDEIGGFLPIVEYLADDYQLGQHVVSRGYQLALCEQVVDSVIALSSWRRLLQHQLRWARTYRICRPGGYFASVLTHGTLWATVSLLYFGFSAPIVAAAAAVVALRYASATILCRHYLRADTSAAQLLLVAPKDLLVSLIWFMAFVGDTVAWSGRRFRVLRDGRMIDVTSGARVVAPARWQRHPDTPPDDAAVDDSRDRRTA